MTAVGTFTLRSIKNKNFLENAQKLLGFDIEIISGEEEAAYIYDGVMHVSPESEGNQLIIDIGGGSTEIIVGDRAYLDNKNIGSFRIDSNNDNKYIESKDTNIDAVIFMDCSLCPIHPKQRIASINMLQNIRRPLEQKVLSLCFLCHGPIKIKKIWFMS